MYVPWNAHGSVLLCFVSHGHIMSFQSFHLSILGSLFTKNNTLQRLTDIVIPIISLKTIWRPPHTSKIVSSYRGPELPQRHDDVIKWKHFPRYWPFVRGIHRSPVNSPHKGPWRGALKFSLICAWINDWVNNRGAGALRRHRAHYDVTVIITILKNTVDTKP